ncbi:MAG: hypothetical protein KDI63_17215 [Gammaproteobacteria bacterium]|nr:hypothetical protein [Gammaproteobacteria bacterium]
MKPSSPRRRDLAHLLRIVAGGLFAALLPLSVAATGKMLDLRIDLAAAYLRDAQLRSGLFRYEHDFLTGKDSSKNNLVRQTGAAFALAEYHADGTGTHDVDVVASVNKALAAFQHDSLPWGNGRLVTRGESLTGAKAGATALALLSLMLISGDKPSPSQQYWIDAWTTGLLALQMADGGFESAPGSGRQSPYANGEIWLALAHLSDRFPGHQPVRRALAKADAHFIEFYTKHPDIGFFHWGVMAASKRYQQAGDSRFVQFAATQSHDYITRLRPNVSNKSNSCYGVEGMLEGIVAFDRHQGFPTLRAMVKRRVVAEMEKNLELQILEGQSQLDFAADRYLRAPEIEAYAGAFLNGRYRPQIRIDATQHCLAAMLKLRRLERSQDPVSRH